MANSDRVAFALQFADKTGLDPTTVYSWTIFESDDESLEDHPHNWLNWKDGADLKGPYFNHDIASDGGTFPGYFNLNDALADGVRRLASSRYDGIRGTVGKGIDAQIAAIKASDWGTHSMSRVNFHVEDLYWHWVSWYLGEGYYKKYGARTRAHRANVFPLPIPLTWWGRLAAFLAASHIKILLGVE